MRIGARATGDERGAAAVELAIVVPVLVMILFGTTTFGKVFSQTQVYIGAAREGSRLAAVRCAPTGPCTNAMIADRVALSSVGYSIGPGVPTADITCDNATLGQPVTVSWVQHFTIDVPFLPDLSRDVEIKGVFRCE